MIPAEETAMNSLSSIDKKGAATIKNAKNVNKTALTAIYFKIKHAPFAF
jgi:hypothetical protein